MKLESLNNSKYSLTPEKMGELVGGEKVIVCSGTGHIKFAATGEVWTYTADRTVYASQQDYNHHMAQSEQMFAGDNDCAKAAEYGCNCR